MTLDHPGQNPDAVGDDRFAVPVGPPWTLDVLADLQAGVFPPHVEADLYARIGDDADAMAMLDALSSVVDQLSLMPTLTMPAHYASRLDAAIDAEATRQKLPTQRRSSPVITRDLSGVLASPGVRPSAPAALPRPMSDGTVRPVRSFVEPSAPRQFVHPSRAVLRDQGPPRIGPPPSGTAEVSSLPPPPAPPAGVTDLDQARSRRRRTGRVVGALAAAAAVAAIATVTIVHQNTTGGGTSVAVPQSAVVTAAVPSTPAVGASVPANAFSIDPGNLQRAYTDLQALTTTTLSTTAYAACMAYLDIPASEQPRVSDATFEGTAVWAVTVPIDATHARIIIVTTGCGAPGSKLADQTVSR